MDDARRKTVAFLCGMYLSKFTNSSIFDYTRKAYYSLDYSFDGQNITVYDYERRCYISGSFHSLFDYGVSGYVDIRIIREGTLEVYDYKSASYLEVTCRDKEISIFDYKVGKYFEYQLN